MNRCTSLLIASILILLTNLAQANQVSNSGEINEIRKEAGKNGKLLMIYFYAPWCEPCNWMSKTTLGNIDVSQTLKENFIYHEVNIDELKGYELKKMYDIKYLPTVIIFNSSGTMIDRLEETLSPVKMSHTLQKHNTIENKNVILHDFNQSPNQQNVAEFQSESMKKSADDYHRYFQTSNIEKTYRVQVAVFSQYQRAEELVKSLHLLTDEPISVTNEYIDDQPMFKVRIGQFETLAEAENYRQNLLKKHYNEAVVI